MSNPLEQPLLQSFLNEHPWPEEMARSNPLDFLWEFKLDYAPEKVWPFVADTSRFNRAIGLGRRSHIEVDGRVIVKDSILGVPQEWIEMPWQWVVNQEISSVRLYSKGAAKYFRAWILLKTDPEKKTTSLIFYFGWIPRNWIWRKLLEFGFSRMHQQFLLLGKEMNQFLAKQIEFKSDFYRVDNPVALDEQAKQSVAHLQQTLNQNNISSAIGEAISKLITLGDELDLQRIRVLSLARSWGFDGDELTKAFLHATEVGCMRLSWDVVCPHCRGPRKASENPGDIQATENCDICQISFNTSSPDSIEITFKIHPRLRKIQSGIYCAAEPIKKAHLLLQTQISGKAKIPLRMQLNRGVYRLRVLGEGFGFIFNAEKNKDSTEPLVFRPGYVTSNENSGLTFSCDLNLILENPDQAAKTFVLEEFWWHSDALRAGDILRIPEFRHFVSMEHLQNDTILDLGVQTIMFTDMVDSTKFYLQHGDGYAYMKVKKHFDVLFKIFENQGGKIVKTVGDSVMVIFDTAEHALHAAAEAQNAFEKNQKEIPIRIRISIHEGAVMAVNFKSGVDYFGASVNYAAKLQSQAAAAEIALSGNIYEKVKQACDSLVENSDFTLRTTQFSLHGQINDQVKVLKFEN